MTPMRLAIAVLLATVLCFGQTRFYVGERTDWENGRAYGNAGPYELITSRVVTNAGEGQTEVLKPRDPAKGNGVLLVEINPRSKRQYSDEELDRGTTFLRLMWKDPGTMQAGVREVVLFLKLTGGPFLLGDQRRFLKRVIYAGDRDWLQHFVAAGHNKDEKERALFDASMPALTGAADIDGAQPLTK